MLTVIGFSGSAVAAGCVTFVDHPTGLSGVVRTALRDAGGAPTPCRSLEEEAGGPCCVLADGTSGSRGRVPTLDTSDELWVPTIAPKKAVAEPSSPEPSPD
mmetsp:Transcript_64082/g.169829  ORF Transcript_64082/g.169829 Transcript_64082/m.169829 type:complete len:101 (+) Transcript_64082:483-785(+)